MYKRRAVPLPTSTSANATFLTLPSPIEGKIRNRWKKWMPVVDFTIARTSAESILPRDARIATLRATHRRAIVSALHAGLSWRAIITRNLDDPFLCESRRQLILHAAVEQKNCRSHCVNNLRNSRRN